MTENQWNTHDFKVKMLDWSAARGSQLAHTCRRCGRRFIRFTAVTHGAWAIDGENRALDNTVSSQWLSQACPRVANATDDGDRKHLRDPVGN